MTNPCQSETKQNIDYSDPNIFSLVLESIVGKTPDAMSESDTSNSKSKRSAQDRDSIIQQVQADYDAFMKQQLDPLYAVVVVQKSTMLRPALARDQQDDRAVYKAVGIDFYGNRKLLSIQVSNDSNGMFMLMEDLRTRGVNDVLVCFSDTHLVCQSKAVHQVFPEASLQLSPRHLILDSEKEIGEKYPTDCLEQVASIYDTKNEVEALQRYNAFAETSRMNFPILTHNLAKHWDSMRHSVEHYGAILPVLNSTYLFRSIIQSGHMISDQNSTHFCDSDLALLFFIRMKMAFARYGKPVKDWRGAKRYFLVEMPERVTNYVS